MGISLKGFGNSNGQGAQIAGLTALPPAASDIRLPAAVAGDPNFANVSLLIPGDSDANDVSNNTLTVTNTGVTISSGEKKFGAGSMYFDGSAASFLKVTADDVLNLGTGDWTMECWLKREAQLDTYAMVYCAGHVGQNDGYYLENGAFQSSTGAVLSGLNTTIGAWVHFALCRDGNTLRAFHDGIEVDSGSVSGHTFNGQTTATYEGMWIGTYIDEGEPWKGYMDDFRVTKGVARYTAAFDVPTEAFPTS